MIICSQIWTFFLIFAVITSKYRKMKTTLHSNFFARNQNLQSKLKNSHFLILTFLYPCCPLMAHKKSTKNFEKKSFWIHFLFGIPNCCNVKRKVKKGDFSGRSNQDAIFHLRAIAKQASSRSPSPTETAMRQLFQRLSVLLQRANSGLIAARAPPLPPPHIIGIG